MAGVIRKFGLLIGGVRVAFLAAALVSFAGASFGGTPYLVRNVNTVAQPQSSYPQYLGSLGSLMLFGASDATGDALWATSGTASGTSVLRRIKVWAQTTFPGSPNYLVMQNRGYFVGDDGVNGRQLWSTDGTASGTNMVANLGASGSTASPVLYGIFGSLLIFRKVDAFGVPQLYVTDGTSAGTRALTSLTGQNSSVSSEFLIAGNKFYFATSGTTGGISGGNIWVSDGTPAGTRHVSNPYEGTSVGDDAERSPYAFSLVGSLVIYGSNGLLWSIDTNTDTLAGVVAGSGGIPGFGPPRVLVGPVAMNGYVVCIAEIGAFGGRELWRSDGTDAGTYPVATISSGPLSFSDQQAALLRRVGDRVLFVGSDAQYGSQLWSSDGTSSNTGRLTNVSLPANSVSPTVIYKAAIGGSAYVLLPDGAQVSTWSMWRTDGTLGGTRLVAGLPPISSAGATQIIGDAATMYIKTYGGTSSLFRYLPSLDSTTSVKNGFTSSITDGFYFNAGSLYFSTNDSVLGDEPWVSDGTQAGTRLLANIKAETTDGGSSPNELVNFKGAVVYVADDGISGRELWRSDGTAAGTLLLADINPGSSSSNPSNLFVANDVLYFFATEADGNNKLMRLSDSPAVFQALASIAPSPPPPPLGVPNQNPTCVRNTPVLLNGQIYFAAYTGTLGLELWASDGTPGGTRLVSDIYPGAGHSNPCQLTILDGQLYFPATSISGGNELWASDGTTGGTRQVADIAPSGLSSSPAGLTVLNGTLYFGASNGSNGRQLWRSNGTVSGTTLVGSVVQSASAFVSPLGIVGNTLLIAASVALQPGVIQNQLWASDGAGPEGTNLSTSRASPAFLANGGVAYFSNAGAVGQEPWISDGTAAGTHLLKDINPTPQTGLLWFADFNGITLFASFDLVAGQQLWRSNATDTGTSLVATVSADIPVTNAPVSDRHRLAVGQTFFFVGNDTTTGSELYALVNDPPVAAAHTANAANGQSVTINVLGNSSDADGVIDASGVQITTSPARGATTVGPNGIVTYVPAVGFEGTDSFTYTLKDNQGATSNAAVVTVSVTQPTVTATSNHGGGGGSLNALILFVLAISLIARMRSAKSV